jgi:hypothetical protein
MNIYISQRIVIQHLCCKMKEYSANWDLIFKRNYDKHLNFLMIFEDYLESLSKILNLL